jgi:hypothetical protein
MEAARIINPSGIALIIVGIAAFAQSDRLRRGKRADYPEWVPA